MEDEAKFDYKDFISKQKSYLIAPAGYGKTHTIAECLKYTKGKQLILTHTHAGVASIKEKIKKLNIPYKNYKVETISSYAQKYVFSFYKEKLPEQEDKEYFNFIIDKATELLKIKLITRIVRNTYTGLFVDEYQDCTQRQHKFILALSDILPTHIVGDPLQGIFGFKNEPIINMEDKNEMGQFLLNKTELKIPWRWKKEEKYDLGMVLKDIRGKLENNEKIDLLLYKNKIEVCKILEYDKYDFCTIENRYREKLKSFESENSLLIIDPESKNDNLRKKLVKNYKFFMMLEPIDNKEFYKIAKIIDNINLNNFDKNIIEVINILFYNISEWFNDKKIKNKQKEKEKIIIEPLIVKFNTLNTKIDFNIISSILMDVKKLPKVRCHRIEMLFSVCNALKIAANKKITVYEAMVETRNIVRRIGRKIYGKCIGTTLLTKGLEFDTVAIIDAHKFKDKKNFYVAITRACKRLIVFSESMELNPYSE